MKWYGYTANISFKKYKKIVTPTRTRSNFSRITMESKSDSKGEKVILQISKKPAKSYSKSSIATKSALSLPPYTRTITFAFQNRHAKNFPNPISFFYTTRLLKIAVVNFSRNSTSPLSLLN